MCLTQIIIDIHVVNYDIAGLFSLLESRGKQILVSQQEKDASHYVKNFVDN